MSAYSAIVKKAECLEQGEKLKVIGAFV